MMAERRQPMRVPSLWPFKARDDIVTVVDLGAQKVACAIACLSAPRFGLDVGARNIRVLGSAVVRSAGFSGGRIINLAATETSIRRAVAYAEAQAGITVEDVIVTGQFQGLASEIFEAKLGSDRTALLKEDIDAISAAAEAHCKSAKRKLLHIFTPAGGSEGNGFAGEDNHPPGETDVIAISMPLHGLRQMAACLSKSLLTARSYIAGPVATALSVTNPIERSVGIFVIDMGAQSTGYALFSRGVPVLVECLGSGGQQVTEDIARTFALRKFEAERLKIRYGSIYDGLQADIDLPAANGDTGEPISKFSLNQCIRFNTSSVFRAINKRLKGAGYSIPIGGVVLAGGGSLLPGVRELASHALAAEVETAKPTLLNGLNAGSALSALIGGCLYASRHQSSGEMPYPSEIASQDSSYASRISQWLRESF
jgi:cell division protein FtsA